MPSRGFFSWGKSRPPAGSPDPKLQVRPMVSDLRNEISPNPPQLMGQGPPQARLFHHPGMQQVPRGSNLPYHRSPSHTDLSTSHDSHFSNKRNGGGGGKFSSPLHSMPPYMHNIPPHLMPHFQKNPPHLNNSRPHSVYWDQHNFPPQLINDDRPGGRYLDPSLQIHKSQQRYSSSFDVSNCKSNPSGSFDRSHGFKNLKPNKNNSSSAIDVRYHPNHPANKPINDINVKPPQESQKPAEGSSVSSGGGSSENTSNSFNTLPPYWVPHEQANITSTMSSNNSISKDGKYSKNKAPKSKNKKAEKVKENKSKLKDNNKKAKKGVSQLSHEKKSKLYKSHEELRSFDESNPKFQPAEDMDRVLHAEKGGPRNLNQHHQMGRLSKAQTLERLDNIDDLDDARLQQAPRNNLFSVKAHHLEPADTRSIDEMKEIQHGPSKEQLWMEEQERMRRSAENIAFRHHLNDDLRLHPQAIGAVDDTKEQGREEQRKVAEIAKQEKREENNEMDKQNKLNELVSSIAVVWSSVGLDFK